MSSTADWRNLYPFESHRLTIGGLRYHYLDEGRGPVLLMVHGNPTWSFHWRHLISAFRDRCRVVVVDHIGCGLSEKPAAGRYPFTLARRVEDLQALIEQLDLRDMTLLAHDWGGAIGLGAAVARPEKFRQLVLFNTGAFRGGRCPMRIRVCRTPGLGQLGVQGLNLFARAAIHMAVQHTERMTPQVRAGLLAPYDCWSHRRAIHQFVADIPLSPNHRSHAKLVEIEEGLSRLADHPVCLVWGMKDWCFTPWFLDRFVEYFPQAEVHRLADAGHYVLEDAPEEVIERVGGFLARHAEE